MTTLTDQIDIWMVIGRVVTIGKFMLGKRIVHMFHHNGGQFGTIGSTHADDFDYVVVFDLMYNNQTTYVSL